MSKPSLSRGCPSPLYTQGMSFSVSSFMPHFPRNAHLLSTGRLCASSKRKQAKILRGLEATRKLALSILYTGASLHDGEEILRLTNETPNNLEAVRGGTILQRGGELAGARLGCFYGGAGKHFQQTGAGWRGWKLNFELKIRKGSPISRWSASAWLKVAAPRSSQRSSLTTETHRFPQATRRRWWHGGGALTITAAAT